MNQGYEWLKTLSKDAIAAKLADLRYKTPRYEPIGYLTSVNLYFTEAITKNKATLKKLGIKGQKLDKLVLRLEDIINKANNNPQVSDHEPSFSAIGWSNNRKEYKLRITYFGLGTHLIRVLENEDKTEVRLSKSLPSLHWGYLRQAVMNPEPVNQEMLDKAWKVIKLLSKRKTKIKRKIR